MKKGSLYFFHDTHFNISNCWHKHKYTYKAQLQRAFFAKNIHLKSLLTFDKNIEIEKYIL